MSQLIVVRHGQSTWNVEHRFTGQADPPLSELGHTQAADLAARCAGLGLDSVVTSDLVRAYATGRAVAGAVGLPDPVRVPGLRERWNRVWEGLTRDQIETRYPGQLDAWREARPLALDGDYEAYESFAGRVVAGLVEASRLGGRVLVVAHAGIFVVLDQLSGEATAGAVANAEGRALSVGPDARISVGEPVRIDAAHRSGVLDP